ncbi:hypothetical protein AWR27_08880 [Spirosoma montaniterrae]|uniref:Uncharacterized protein n=1 Tax=Spirosoma montaniterrae TaxID=1178516 RepID=A0A1P9WVL4_9BACT|nr:hypothetical protein AWR27_08880 [Spirosoma montaniterrae]
MIRIAISFLLLVFYTLGSSTLAQQPPKIQIMLLGSNHFGQAGFYKDAPLADLFIERRQQELQQLRDQLARFKPDLILIEREPTAQSTTDSLYRLYTAGKLALTDLDYGRAETYQIAYALGKTLRHDRIYGVDYYGGTSNRILNQGQGIEYYLDELKTFNVLGSQINEPFRQGKTTVSGYLRQLNAPEVLQKTYHLMFVTPAKVRRGLLNTTDRTLDSSRVSYDYVGADFISHFYNRELRIYANIVATQLAQKKQRILVVMGQRHAAVLTKIFENDPDYTLVPVGDYLK